MAYLIILICFWVIFINNLGKWLSKLFPTVNVGICENPYYMLYFDHPSGKWLGEHFLDDNHNHRGFTDKEISYHVRSYWDIKNEEKVK